MLAGMSTSDAIAQRNGRRHWSSASSLAEASTLREDPTRDRELVGVRQRAQRRDAHEGADPRRLEDHPTAEPDGDVVDDCCPLEEDEITRLLRPDRDRPSSERLGLGIAGERDAVRAEYEVD